MYELCDYDTMFADAVRTRAFLDAIAHAVRPGDVVVEIGTGVGYFAVAAARAGARRVYAIELSDVAEVALEVVADNGYADVVEVIRGDAAVVSLPERGTLLIEDLRGVLPTFGRRIPLLVDARARHLVPDARFLATRETLWAVPVVAPVPEPGADALGDAPHGIVRTAVAKRLRDDWRRVRLSARDQLAEPACLAAIDLARVASPDVEGEAVWTIARDGRAEGIAVWFDADFQGGARITNAPAAPRALYGQAFFPFTQAIAARSGDRLHCAWRAVFVGDDYVYAWHTTYSPASGDVTEYRQSTLRSLLPPHDELARARARAQSPFP